MRRKIRGLAISGAICGLALSAAAHAQTATEQPDVKSELAALKAEVAQLRKDQGANWLNERRAEEVKTLIKEVLSDADTRASLEGNGMMAGHNGSNFYLASEDGTFLLKLWGQLQVRYIYNTRDNNDSATDENETGFQIRRAKIGFEGFIGSPKLEYKILFAPNRDTTTVELEDAWVAYNVMDNLKVWGGRFQDRWARESYMSSKSQQTVERSAVANIFSANDNFVEGAGVEWKALPDMLILAVTVNDGLASGASQGAGKGFQNSGNDFNNDGTDVAFSGRVDAKLAGDWKSMGDVEAWSKPEGLQAFIGAGVHYEIGETGDRQGSSNFTVTSPGLGTVTVPYDDFLEWTVDGIVKIGGLGVMGAFYGWDIYDATIGGDNHDLNNYAATIQAGYLINDKVEPFIRYEWISVDNDLETNDLNLLTFGFNYFLKKHQAKFTLDAVWAMNNINSANTLGTGLTGAGLLSDDSDQENQVSVRAQFQLLF